MPLTVRNLDDRDYKALLNEALARIPVHNPEWTNFNDSDPGVTLLQLFAFLSESLLYRANQIPERNREKFLTLLGIPLRPAAAARGFVVLRNERGPLAAVQLGDRLDVRAGAVRFETTQGLYVLPVEARLFYKRLLPPASPDDEEGQAREDLYRLLYTDLLQDGVQPAFYETVPLPQPTGEGALPVVDVLNDTVDRCLWIALLARKNESPDAVRPLLAGKTLTVGVMPMLSAEGIHVQAGQSAAASAASRVVWEIADVTGSPRYAALPASPTGDLLNEPGLVELTLPAAVETWQAFEPGEEGTGDYPPSLVDTDFGDRVVTWLRMRIPDKPAENGNEEGGAARALISWVDINATEVVQRARVSGEVLGTGSGEPDQSFTLANVPVIPQDFELLVNDQPWTRLDDLLAAPPEIPVEDPRLPLYAGEHSGDPHVYTLDPESGRVGFGDGAHGARPHQGARIVANYYFGGGRQGNLGSGAINRSPQLPAGFKIANPLRTWGGDDAESVDSAQMTIPSQVQHRDRLVSVRDFKDITWRTPGVDLGRVEVLPLYDPVNHREEIPGVVTILVVPLYDPQSPQAPLPDRFFLDTVCEYLQPRRLITTELHIRGPVYRDVAVSAGVQLVGGYAAAPVLETVKQTLRDFLSPLTGGRAGTGWPLDTAVLQRELEAVVANVEGVRFVDELHLGYVENGAVVAAETVGIELLQLPRLIAVDANLQATPLSELLAAPSVVEEDFTPIPVIPEAC